VKLLGVIAEYNPFHFGHEYHLNKARELSQADGVVVVMSGFFCQRGLPAMIHPWARAEAALKGGADLVLLLPTAYSLNNADVFALGGVSLLNSLPKMKYLSFGSEDENIADLKALARAIVHDKELNQRAKELQGLGGNYGRNLSLALKRDEKLAPLAQLLDKPNNILAIAYLKALEELNSSLLPLPVLRQGADFLDEQLKPMASATALRQALAKGESIKEFLPEYSFELIEKETAAERLHLSVENFAVQILTLLHRQGVAALKDLPEMNEGLENRFWAKRDAKNISDLIGAVKSKRHPHSKLQRLLFQLLLDIKKEDVTDIDQVAPYAYILAMNGTGQEILAAWRKDTPVMLIDRPLKQMDELSQRSKRFLEIDLLAAQLWSLALANEDARVSIDFSRIRPVRVQ
jgi:predicted nucleotidyltransferase